MIRWVAPCYALTAAGRDGRDAACAACVARRIDGATMGMAWSRCTALGLALGRTSRARPDPRPVRSPRIELRDAESTAQRVLSAECSDEEC
jgi:hypothetical protein